MNDTDKKMLTEWMGECWHTAVQDERGAGVHCWRCRTRTPINRTFTTWQDLGDVKDKLVEKGLWEGFIIWLVSNEILENYTYQEKYLLAAGDIGWLFRPVDEKGEPHFCGLVAKFKPWEKEAGI